MKIFITGGTGFLGKTIVKKLLTDNHQVTCLLLPNDDASLLPGAGIIRGDITRPDTLTHKTKGHGLIIHLAGAVGYGQTWNNCIRLNKDGTSHIRI